MRSIERTARIMGSDVHYWVYNDDQPRTIVMIHGFRGTHHGLHDIIALLPDFRVVIPDLPGFGQSTPFASGTRHNIASYAAFARELTSQLGLDGAPLLGHSFGSIVAAKAAADSSEVIGKLILINPIATPPLKGPNTVLNQLARFYYWLGAALPERAGLALLGNRAIVLATSRLLAKTKDKQLRADIDRHHLRHFSSFQTRQALLEAFDASIDTNVSDFASKLTMPTLLIAGAVDTIAPLKGARQLAQQLPDAQLVVIQKVGHLIHREAPKQAAEAIRDFLAEG